MSFKAILELDEQRFNVLEAEISFSQQIDSDGKPRAKSNGGLITLTIESSLDSSVFMKWMLDSTATKSGLIRFIRRDEEGSLKIIEFTDALCIQYDEHFKSTGEVPMTIRMTITPRKFKCGEAVLEKDWYLASSK